MSKRVVIVGGGIGGLTAALAMLRRDIDVDVYERAPQLSEVGAGLTMSPNGTRLFFELGLKEKILDLGVRSQKRQLRLWNTGESWEMADQGVGSEERYGAPYILMHRGDLHNSLTEAVRALKPDVIHLDHTCVDARHDPDGAEVIFADGTTVRGDVLVGADGVHSTIRQKLHKLPPPVFSGKAFWRGMIPMDFVPKAERNISGSWVSPRNHVTVYPVRRGELLNFVGTVHRDEWNGFSWTEEGTKEECLEDYVGWHENIIEMIENFCTPYYKWGAFVYKPAPNWTIGRTTLLGDACHAMPPSLGQGAMMATEDAVVLARCLDAERDAPERGLERYNAARSGRATTMVEQSWSQNRRRHNEALADASKAASYISANWSSSKVSERYDWIYEYDANQVAI